jgi:hypothetical protein
MKENPLPHYIDEPLVIAHLLGGANGVDVSHDITNQEIARRVAIAIKYGKEILRQLNLTQEQPTKKP